MIYKYHQLKHRLKSIIWNLNKFSLEVNYKKYFEFLIYILIIHFIANSIFY